MTTSKGIGRDFKPAQFLPKPLAEPFWVVHRCRTCHGFFVAAQVHEGTTPITMPCKASPFVQCQGKMEEFALSRNGEGWKATVPRQAMAEWYCPDRWEQARMKRKYPKLYAHVQLGNLILRPTNEDTPTLELTDEKAV